MLDNVRRELRRFGQAVPKMIVLLVIGAPFALSASFWPGRWAIALVVFGLVALIWEIEVHVIDTEHELSEIRNALADLDRQISGIAIDTDSGRAGLAGIEAELSKLRRALSRQ